MVAVWGCVVACHFQFGLAQVVVDYINFCELSFATKSGADTKGLFGDNVTSRLILEYTSSGLAVTRTNATLNCIYDKVGLACEPTIEGNVLHYKVYIPSEEAANCVCLCERMSSTVSGLEEGKEYVLEYSSPDAKLGKISFKYKRGLRLSVDVDDYRVWD